LKIITIGICIVLAILIVAAAWLWTPDLDRRTLEARYLRSPADMVDVAGVRLHIRDTGPRDAPAVVLLHGFGSSLDTWDAWAEGLQQDFRVVRLDLPGCGLSSPDATGVYTDARTLTILLALMDRLGLARASVVGHSIGGRMAWTLAALHPERVNKLVLVSPDGFASPGFAYGQQPEVPASLALMRYFLPKFLLRMSLEPAYADPAVMTDALADRYHALMLGPGSRAAMLARMQQTVLTDPVPLLQRIQATTLLLWGQKDVMIPFSNSADYAKALPRSTLAPLPGVGHVPQEEAPQASLKVLRDFLKLP
jgi:pimeloyl-ACP methyl ester carboxylesterase